MKIKLILIVLLVFTLGLYGCTETSTDNSDVDVNNGINGGVIEYPSIGDIIRPPIVDNGQQGSEDDEDDLESAETTSPSAVDIYIVASIGGVNIRSGAGTSYKSVGRMDKADMLGYYGKEGNWYKTIYKEQTAYVSAVYSYLMELPKANDAIEAVIEIGKSLMGYPYIWGSQRYHWGNGKLNTNFVAGRFDCSALTQYIFYKGANVLLDLTTRTQVVQGTNVEKADIARGDLLFFTNASRKNNKGVERVGHVALYLGDNYILHTASDFAVIEPISPLRWSYYITARRFL